MVVHCLVLIFIILYILTGLGIADYKVIETVTFGRLSKLGAYQLHSVLLYPFVVILALHIGLSFVQNRQKRNINVA